MAYPNQSAALNAAVSSMYPAQPTQATIPPPPQQTTPARAYPAQPVTADDMEKWNKLIAYAKLKGYAGQEALNHDPALRQRVFDEYNKANPNDAVPINRVQDYQDELLKYKQKTLNDKKAGIKMELPANFMNGLSKSDNIFGSLTSQYSFPVGYWQGKKAGFAPKVDDQIQKAAGVRP